MSGPHGTAEPPSILLAWSDVDGSWRATAVLIERACRIAGPSTSVGKHPTDALQALLERRFCALADSECPATELRLASAASDKGDLVDVVASAFASAGLIPATLGNRHQLQDERIPSQLQACARAFIGALTVRSADDA